MTDHSRRGVSLGTIFMAAVTLAVLIGCAIVFPRLMGDAGILLEDRAMLTETNLNDALPELAMSDIPIAPEATPQPEPEAPTAAPAPEPSASPEPTHTPEPQAAGAVSLTFAGSVCMDDLTRKSGYYSDSEKYDFTDNLSLIASEMESDCTFITLEGITDPSGNVRQVPNAPDEVMDMLAQAHVDMVALGWNRAYERGASGAAATLAEARKRGLSTIGLYDSQQDAQQIRIIEAGGLRTAYLHYAAAVSNTSKRHLKAEDSAWAMPAITIGKAGMEVVSADIRRAREQGAHIVVVSLNWSGVGSVSTTSSTMKGFMQGLADAGADVIVGAGTKAVREVSWLMGKREDGSTRQTLCAWSLGSLLNGERGDGNVAGMLLHVQLSVTGGNVSFSQVTYTPTYIWRFKADDYYRYRVVASDLPAPEGMDASQAANAERAFANLKKSLGNSPITLRVK